MGIQPPKPPEYSYTANAILHAYNMIARSRRYEQGTPLALNIADIEVYCDLYDVPVELDIFVDCIFAIDNDFLDESHKRMQQKIKKK